MFELLKAILKYHKGAITGVIIVNLFTFIPAATLFGLEEGLSLFYFIAIGFAAFMTSFIFFWVTRDVKDMVRHFSIKMIIFFVILAAIVAPGLLTFYHMIASFLVNFFEEVYSRAYFGPDRLIAYYITLGFYNLFFIGDYIKGIISLFRKTA